MNCKLMLLLLLGTLLINGLFAKSVVTRNGKTYIDGKLVDQSSGNGDTIVSQGMGDTVVKQGQFDTIVKQGMGDTVAKQGQFDTVVKQGMGDTVVKQADRVSIKGDTITK